MTYKLIWHGLPDCWNETGNAAYIRWYLNLPRYRMCIGSSYTIYELKADYSLGKAVTL